VECPRFGRSHVEKEKGTMGSGFYSSRLGATLDRRGGRYDEKRRGGATAVMRPSWGPGQQQCPRHGGTRARGGVGDKEKERVRLTSGPATNLKYSKSN
jgi:hypothetical protein